MKISPDKRYFIHQIPKLTANHSDYIEVSESGKCQISPSFKIKISEGTEKLLSLFESNLENGTDWTDGSVYTGLAGYAYLYYLMETKPKISGALETARKYVERSVGLCRGKYLPFLTGDAGPFTLGAIIYHRLGDTQKSEFYIGKLKELANSHHVDKIGTKLPDEILYGRAGYLSALLLAREEIDNHVIEDSLIKQVVSSMIASGEDLAKKHPELGAPLMYKWHDSYYLGGAHGLTGILLFLLKVKGILLGKDLEMIQATIDFLVELRYPSGNLPSSLGSTTDKLVHWCHGAPGFTALLIEASKVFGSPKYMEAAEKCCDVIWERGLLVKGYGLCHGAAGNAYSFVQMYQATKDPKYIHQACAFADFCLDYGKHGCRTPDTPLSLYEGLAGTIYFLYDIMEPDTAKFPGF
ncbi:glutathione S-transferase LANCL1-like [Artemia franciscana]|uniref:glutathione S-transferase LANCL1-like n=1 Tax=Artemia franciscana TaxID=6661 RepID=UPI0032DB876C